MKSSILIGALYGAIAGGIGLLFASSVHDAVGVAIAGGIAYAAGHWQGGKKS